MRRWALLRRLAIDARNAGEHAAPASARVRAPVPSVVPLADLAYGPDPAQRLDVYAPAGVAGAPILLMIHGGGWRRGDKAAPPVIDRKVSHWCGHGWVVVSANYRLDADESPLMQAQDVAQAMAFVVRAAADWGGDGDRIALMGHSAGAHLAALLTADPTLVAGVGGPARWLATVVLDTGALDVVELMHRRHLPLHDAVFGDDPGTWPAMSPLHRLQGPPAAPMLIVCSSRRPGACRQGHAFAARARGLGGTVSVFEVDASHGGINAAVGADDRCTPRIDAFLRQARLL